MAKKNTSPLKGTVDLLILRTLALEPRHGVGVADRIRQMTQGAFALGPGSLFPALHRLEQRGWIKGEWKETDEGSRARFYQLTPAGRKQYTAERTQWRKFAATVERVLDAT